MALYTEFITDNHDYKTYEDLKNNFKIKTPKNFNFSYDIVDRYALEEPNKRAMVWCDEESEKTFTFTDLSIASQKTANFLTSHGIKKGDSVMLILRRRYEFWYFMLALHRIGAIAIPATIQLLEHDIEYRTNAADVKMIVVLEDDVIQEEVNKALSKSPTVKSVVCIGKKHEGWISFDEEYESCSSNFPRPTGENATKNEDPMLLYFTSGTSGYPKMVAHNFLYPLGHIITAKFWQNCIENELHLSIAETGWGKAVWGKLYGQWLSGAAVFVYDMLSFKPDAMLHKIEKYKIATFCAPPTIYRYLIRQDLKKYDLSSLKYCVTAGEALNAEVYNRFYEQTGIKMFEAYGQTESTVICGNFPGMEPKPGSMGKPAPGYDVAIVNSDGKVCAPEEIGEIVINIKNGRPFGLFAGYFKNPELTAEAFDSGWYHTKDTAKMDKDGYIWFIGRNDDLIKSAGYRVSPFEVESVLQQHESVLECAVTGVSDPRRGQLIKATIVLSQGYEATNELKLELKDFVNHELSSYKRPRIFEFVEELPKTISGKIRRVEIRETHKSSEEE